MVDLVLSRGTLVLYVKGADQLWARILKSPCNKSQEFVQTHPLRTASGTG